MTYRTARGRQMIALATGSGDDTSLIVFALRSTLVAISESF
jgi:hypothetical protein